MKVELECLECGKVFKVGLKSALDGDYRCPGCHSYDVEPTGRAVEKSPGEKALDHAYAVLAASGEG